MAEYLSPGVYVEEISTGPRPIEGVSTSTAGFAGLTERGPEYPMLVTSWLEFQRWFGSYLGPDVSYLAYAVQGFFDNGGKRLFIASVVPGAVKRGQAGTLPTRGMATLGDLTIWANGRGVWGNRVYVAIEKASKAKALLPGDPSPVGKWLKVSLLYYTVEPPSKVFKVFDAASAAEALAEQSTKAAASAVTAAASAKAAIALDQTVPANLAAAKAAVAAAKTAADDMSGLVDQLAGQATQARGQAAAAVMAFPNDANLKAAKTAADAAATAAANAKTSADQAAKDADASAVAPAPTAALGDAAVASIGKASTDITTTVTAVNGLFTAASTAYPLMLVNQRAGESAAAIEAARLAAETAKADVTAWVADNADNVKKTAAKKALADAKTAVAASGAAALALQTAAGQANVAADAKTAIDKAKTSTDTAVTDTNTAVATDPMTTASVDTAIGSIGAAKADTGAAATAVTQALDASNAAAPTLLAVNPLFPENQRTTGFKSPDHLEVYDNLRPLAGASNSLQLALNSSSQLVQVEVDGANIPLSPVVTLPDGKQQAIFTALSGGAPGNDGTNPVNVPNVTDFAGSEAPVDETNPIFGTGSGLAGLAGIEDISLLAAPDEVTISGLSEEVIKQCELLRDRFGIVSTPFGNSNVANVRPTQDTTYAAYYYPWISVFDPLSNGPIFIPPTGHVTGLIARVDIDRGVHKAPANEVLRDANDLEFPIPKGKQDLLNPIGVNCIRDFRPQGRSIRVWGARTMTSDPEWRYINVRRLFIFVEKSIQRGTQWVVFEPNDAPLWSNVSLSITNFLTTVWRNGALMGRTPEEAFFVRCDRTTMTQDDIDNGRLICLIGIAPTKPAEFVIFRISQKMVEAAQ